MKKKELQEAMTNFQEGSKVTSYLDLLARSKAPLKLFKGKGRKYTF